MFSVSTTLDSIESEILISKRKILSPGAYKVFYLIVIIKCSSFLITQAPCFQRLLDKKRNHSLSRGNEP